MHSVQQEGKKTKSSMSTVRQVGNGSHRRITQMCNTRYFSLDSPISFFVFACI